MDNGESWLSRRDGCRPKHCSLIYRRTTSRRTLGRTASLSGRCTREVSLYHTLLLPLLLSHSLSLNACLCNYWNETASAIIRLQQFMAAINHWIFTNLLTINPVKTELGRYKELSLLLRMTVYYSHWNKQLSDTLFDYYFWTAVICIVSVVENLLRRLASTSIYCFVWRLYRSQAVQQLPR